MPHRTMMKIAGASDEDLLLSVRPVMHAVGRLILRTRRDDRPGNRLGALFDRRMQTVHGRVSQGEDLPGSPHGKANAECGFRLADA